LTKEDKDNWGHMDNICVIPNANTFSTHQPACREWLVRCRGKNPRSLHNMPQAIGWRLGDY
jgi:hypothetical protein